MCVCVCVCVCPCVCACNRQTSQSAPETVCKDVYNNSYTINESPNIDLNEILIASLIHSPFFYGDISNLQGDMELFYYDMYYTHLTPLQ